jgi:hypothetical protein
MANASAKKNEKNIQSVLLWMQIGVFGSVLWFLGFNTLGLLSESISIWKYLLCALVSFLSYFCYKQILKCWELQLPAEAAEYYIDILLMNCIVQVFDFYTQKVWYSLFYTGTSTGCSLLM